MLLRTKTVIHLTGGLGNQLFQLAAGLYSTPKDNLVFEKSLGKPRVNKKLIPDICEYDLAANIQENFLQNSNQTRISQRIINFALRSGSSSKGLGRFTIGRAFIASLGSIVLTIQFSQILILRVGQGIGYFKSGSRRRFLSSYQVGYFQSYKWASTPHIFEQLQAISLVNPSAKISQLIDQAKRVKPVVIHIRLGDYKGEGGFGILGKEYYKKSLQSLTEVDSSAEYWFFSDEPELAREYLKDILPEGKWIQPEIGSSAEVLELMRYGSAYVIANSSFSWWAAFLRKDQRSQVVAPDPWFKTGSPEDLLPPSWLRVAASSISGVKVM